LRQEGQRLLAARIEQALRAELRLELLDPREQLADPDLAQLLQLQRELAAAPVEDRLSPDHDPLALRRGRQDLLVDPARAGDAHRHVLRRVAQGQEHHPGTRAAADLGDLPLHVDHAEPVDPLRHQRRHRGDRHRRFEGALHGHGPTLERSYDKKARTGVSPVHARCVRGWMCRARKDRRAGLGVRPNPEYHGCMVPAPVSSDTVPRKRVLLAAPRGYCAGVDRAVQTVENALERFGAPVYVRKEIVHNKHVVQTLEERGAIFVEENEEVPEGSLVIFSAHGVAPDVHDGAKRRNLRTIDATCPLVTKVHKEAVRFADEGYDILLIGHEGHEEVIGTTGEAPEHIKLVDGPDSVDSVEVRDPARVAWLSQTTLSVDETQQTVAKLKQRFPQLLDPPSDDICYATQNRQVAVKQIAGECDLLLVVGSKNSSNSVRLVEVALEVGVPASYLVDFADEVDPAWFEGVSTVGLTSGASVPENLVQDVLGLLAEHGYVDVEEVRSAQESLLFALPHELKRL
jgi:4-hydroxy-3-methylbut-2-enyl diphosphate reductase